MPVVKSLERLRIPLLGSFDGLRFFGLARLSLPFFYLAWRLASRLWRFASGFVLRFVLRVVLCWALLSAL
jgi:hypothetical protein